MAIKFQTDEPRTLCYPYADYLEVSGQYGTQFLYTVEVEGLRDRSIPRTNCTRSCRRRASPRAI